MAEPKQFAVVTGASSGIGLELARQFAEHDFDVLINAEDDGLAAVAGQLAAGSGADIQPVQADLATPQGVEQLVSAINAANRPVDALAVNAGVGNGGAFLDIPLEDEQRLIALNIGSAVHLTKRLLPAMVAGGAGRLAVHRIGGQHHAGAVLRHLRCFQIVPAVVHRSAAARAQGQWRHRHCADARPHRHRFLRARRHAGHPGRSGQEGRPCWPPRTASRH